MADSTCTIVGNLTRDPELRFTAAGKAVCNLGVAVNHRFQQNGEWQEKVSFLNVTAWGPLGENVAASTKKGDRVIVTGRLDQRSWEDTDGKKHNAVEIIADEIGASFRWARAEIEKVVKAEATVGAPTGNRAPDPVYGDEETF